ncbi:hypothetical protein [Rhodopseudomonas palustris]|uniref:hypothetical protein n=1 Tax=Rhodopseudomonas palustris TaxID=1076 RepID=UPI001058C45E|nr:hypothetical protein [Rhodopseudomonas palustris]QLH71659.1 hypothetical protein HZF03_13020 [Rhodopseudomonas palustris]
MVGLVCDACFWFERSISSSTTDWHRIIWIMRSGRDPGQTLSRPCLLRPWLGGCHVDGGRRGSLMVLRGQIEAVTSSGYVTGWACNLRRPCVARLVTILNDAGRECGHGFANYYRPDLVSAKIGTGWHGFRVRVEPFATERSPPLTLVDRFADQQLCTVEPLEVGDDVVVEIESFEQLVAIDPTVVGSVDELAGCERVFDSVIGRDGVEAYVKRAYVYVLGRAVDAGGLALYSRKLRRREITPFGLIQILSSSDEFQSRPRLLTSPSATGFPFG